VNTYHAVDVIPHSGLFSPLTSFIFFVTAALVVCLVVSMNNDTVSDFYIANGKMSPVWNALALCGDYLSASSLITFLGAVALTGFDGMAMAVSAILGLGILFLLAEPLRNTGRFTLGDVLGNRIGADAARIAGAVITLAVCLPLTVVQLAGSGVATAYLVGLDTSAAAQVCTALTGTLMIMFAAFGGMRGTSVIQIAKAVLVFFAVLLVAAVVLHRFDWNFGAMMDTAERKSLQPDGFYIPGRLYGHTTTGSFELFSAHLTVALGAAVTPHLIMRVSASRDGRSARRATRYAVMASTVFFAAVVAVGLGAAAVVGGQAIVGDDPRGNTALFLLAGTLAGGPTTTLGGIVFTVVACAVFVTALAVVAGLTLAAAAALAHDIYAQVIRRGRIKEENEVSAVRWAVVAVGVLSVLSAIGLHNWSFLFLTLFATNLAASTILPALVYSLFWKGFTRTGLLWTIYGSMVCCVVLQVSGPTVSGDPLALFPGRDFQWFPLQNAGLITVPFGFVLGWAGSRLGRHAPVDRIREAEAEARLLAGVGSDTGTR
jgi:SSS family solute:Na+ symporter/cation/acetate symporter